MTDPRDREAAERLLRRWQDGAGDGWDTLVGCVASALAEARRDERSAVIAEWAPRVYDATMYMAHDSCDAEDDPDAECECGMLAALTAVRPFATGHAAASPEGPSEEPTNG
ncbi:MAG TPA: hypothetical protein VEJ18_03605 [Planctomycetota bacterium]|nr:hypothetical protein [Planctomycetota bacterium]